MADSPVWPPYLVAPPDSIHALGVVSINFARFEYSIGWVLSAISGLSDGHARIILARSGAAACLQMIEQILASQKWDETIGDAVGHFVRSAKILTENRNALIHANFVHGLNRTTTLYRIPKHGGISQFDMNLSQIRQIADELNLYFYFGQSIANAIGSRVDLGRHQKAEFPTVPTPWPDKPPLPMSVEDLKSPSSRRKGS